MFFLRAGSVITLFAIGFVILNLIGCGADEAETEEEEKKQLTAEEQKHLARFVEYVFFPTSPYVDKSWVETDVPEEEVAEAEPIDFPKETAAIQQIYTEVYNAWEAADFETVSTYFYPSTIRFVFICGGELGPVFLTLLSKYSLRNPRNVCNGGWAKLSSTPLLTDFYIRRKNIQAPWPEASAKTPDDTYIYLTKRGDRWYLNELVVADKKRTRKYFDDPRYKAP